MATTSINPFVVQVVFHGVTYDTKIIPMIKGKDVPAHVDLLNRAQTTNQLFSRTIEEMLEGIENYSFETHGDLTEGSAEGFKFEKHVAYKPAAELWQNFVNTLHRPAEHMVVSHPSIPVVSGSGARIEIKPNAYCNLRSEEQRNARLGLFSKKCWDHFSQQEGAVLPRDYKESEYSPEETDYLKLLYNESPEKRLKDEIWFIYSHADEFDQIEMARIQDQIKVELQLKAI